MKTYVLKKRICLVLLVFFFCWPQAGSADLIHSFLQERTRYMTGEVVRIESTWIYVKDEQSIETVCFFVHKERLKKFHVGDRVRVHYQRAGGQALSIQRMTPVEYEAGKKNAGYLFGQPQKGTSQ